ncbi:MAG: hypothetical protein R3F11_27970, partial [Verrucomicrobiales bacterium]
ALLACLLASLWGGGKHLSSGHPLRSWTGEFKARLRALIDPLGFKAQPSAEEQVPRDRTVFAIAQAIAAAYVVSAISKLIASGGTWLAQLPNIALQLRKNERAEYFNTLSDAGGAAAGFLERLVIDHPNLAIVFFGIGFVLELFAFAALLNRRLMALFGIGLIGLHVMVSHFMQLGFFFNKFALLIVFVNVPFWLVAAIRSRRTP